MNINIIYEDDSVIVAEKPRGLSSQETRGLRADMVSLLRNHLAGKMSDGRSAYVGVVHRLDTPVRGVMVYAKTRKAAAALSAGIASGTFSKTYTATVCGCVEEKGSYEDWLLKEKDNFSRVVQADTPGAKKALLLWQRLGFDGQTSKVRIDLLTGRHHQIRVQFSAHGHPLTGDTRYGGTGGEFDLTAQTLSFVHPDTGRRMTFSLQ